MEQANGRVPFVCDACMHAIRKTPRQHGTGIAPTNAAFCKRRMASSMRVSSTVTLPAQRMPVSILTYHTLSASVSRGANRPNLASSHGGEGYEVLWRLGRAQQLLVLRLDHAWSKNRLRCCMQMFAQEHTVCVHEVVVSGQHAASRVTNHHDSLGAACMHTCIQRRIGTSTRQHARVWPRGSVRTMSGPIADPLLRVAVLAERIVAFKHLRGWRWDQKVRSRWLWHVRE